ncbi:MAG: pitrilysin family protein [Elusimicrobia bacterium]|nr:pitrilysin family protein [Elusimicrobiota bacterium]
MSITRILFIIAMMHLTSLALAGGTVTQLTLTNGIHIIHKEVKSNPIVTVQVFITAGIIDEQPAEAGVANFSQIIMMKGTETRSDEQLSREIEDIGAHLSADVDYDFSNVAISVTKGGVHKAAELLADIIRHPVFPATEIEKERTAVLASLKSRHDQIFHTANDQFSAIFYGNHPYSWPDAGKPETVSAMTRETLMDWHRRHYTATHIFIVVAGDISSTDSRTICETYFGDIAPGKTPKPFLNAVPLKPQSDIVPSTKFQQAYLMIGYAAPDVRNSDFCVMKMINALMGSRMSGRLFTELREKMSLGYEVNSFYPTRKTLSRFVIYLGLINENRTRAEKRINEMIAELKTTPVPDQELTDTKNYIRGVYLLDHQTIGRQAWNLGWWEVLGRGYAYDEKYLNDLMSVTPEDIRRVANRYFTGDYFKVEVVPAEKK